MRLAYREKAGGSFLWLRVRAEISAFEAVAQGHAGTVKHDPEVRCGDAECLTDRGTGLVVHFAHDKDGGGALGELAEAGLERGEEFGAGQGLFAAGIPFARGAVVVMPELVTVELVREFILEEGEVGETGLAAELAKVVADFVLQDAKQPGPDGRTPAELFRGAQCGEQRVLHEIGGGVGVAHAEERGAVEAVTVFLEPFLRRRIWDRCRRGIGGVGRIAFRGGHRGVFSSGGRREPKNSEMRCKESKGSATNGGQ